VGGAPEDTGLDTGAPEPDPSHVFTYAILADPHVTNTGEHATRLNAAVAAIEALPADQAPELVFILGDIAWNDGWAPAHDALDALSMPWIPVLGDNPIQSGEETGFEDTFSAHLDAQGADLPGWVRAARPVTGDEGEDLWLQNARLDWKGVRFVAVDLNTRTIASGWGELPDLFDVPGGTLPFLTDALETVPDGPEDRIVLLSHMPLVPGLTLDEQDDLLAVLDPHPGKVWGNHAGHLHGNGEATWDEATLEIRTTDATWDDVNTFRLVEVWSNGARFSYRDTLVELPE
jgi:hypothetical protein